MDTTYFRDNNDKAMLREQVANELHKSFKRMKRIVKHDDDHSTRRSVSRGSLLDLFDSDESESLLLKNTTVPRRDAKSLANELYNFMEMFATRNTV